MYNYNLIGFVDIQRDNSINFNSDIDNSVDETRMALIGYKLTKIIHPQNVKRGSFGLFYKKSK